MVIPNEINMFWLSGFSNATCSLIIYPSSKLLLYYYSYHETIAICSISTLTCSMTYGGKEGEGGNCV